MSSSGDGVERAVIGVDSSPYLAGEVLVAVHLGADAKGIKRGNLPGDGSIFGLGLLNDDETILSGSRNRAGRGNSGQDSADGEDLLGEHLESSFCGSALVVAQKRRDYREHTG